MKKSAPKKQAAAPAASSEPKPSAWAGFKEAALQRKPGPLLELKPSDLTPHPLLERVTMRPELIGKLDGRRDWKDEAGEERLSWQAFCDDIKTRGVREPLRVARIDGAWKILDGRHRWLAAKDGGLATVSCIEDRPEDARAVILAAVTHRRRITAAAAAYMWVMMFPEVATEGKAGRPGKEIMHAVPNLTQGELAKRSGVSERWMREACATYKHLATRPKERARDEPLIVAGLLALGAARTGLNGKTKDEGGTGGREATDWYGRNIAALNNVTHWSMEFGRLDPAEKKELAEKVCAQAAEWPLEYRQMIAGAIAAAGDKPAPSETKKPAKAELKKKGKKA